MADKKITTQIVVDVVTTGAKKSFDLLKKGAAGVGKAVGGVFKAFKSLAIVGAIGGAITGAFSKNQKVVDAFNKVLNTVSIIFGQIAEAVFGAFEEQSKLNGGFDATKKVLGGLISGVLNIFLGTIQSIKLGVLVAQRAWEDSFFGGGDEDKIKQLTEDINETKEALKQTGSAIVDAGKQVGSNFVEALEETAGAAAAVVQAVVDTTKTLDLEKASKDAERLVNLQKAAALADAERQRIQLEYQRSAEQLRQLRDDETKSIEVRQKANEDLLALLEEQAEKEAEQIRTKIASAAATYEVTKTTEDLVALKQAELELTDLTERLEGQRSEALSNQNALLKEQTDIARANTEANLSRLEQELDTLAELQTTEKAKLDQQLLNIQLIKDARLAAIDDELAQTAEGTARFAELLNQRLDVVANAANEEDRINKERGDMEVATALAVQEQIVGIRRQGLDAIAQLADAFAGDDEKKQKKAFELNKKLSIATTLIDTFQAVVGAMKATGPDGLLFPFPVRLANAAIAGAIGIANVKKIQSTQFGSTGGSASVGGGASAGAATPVNPNTLLGGFQAGNNTVGPENQQPVFKTYVVAEDVTNQQQADKRIKDRARL